MDRREPRRRTIFFYPWERRLTALVTPFEEFIHRQTTSGIVLMIGAVAALLLANSPFAEAYVHLIHTPISLSIGPWQIERSLLHWINEGLMTFFFFVVGLEIKREVLVGELADLKRAALPIVAAVGGMIMPALIFALVNGGGVFSHGWGIPMATDIAFCVGALVMLGRRVPATVMMFLVSLAIADDLGAVAVIAIFYTSTINAGALAAAALVVALLVGFNQSGVRGSFPYLLAGILLWALLLTSGIHATVAGILVAFCVPARARYRPEAFAGRVGILMKRYRETSRQDGEILTNTEQYAILQAVDDNLHLAEAPLQRMERAVHLPVALLVIPAFALTNAGIPLEMGRIGEAFGHPVTLGVFLGLVVGKLVGISGFSWLAIRLGFAALPSGMGMRHVIGVGLLAGIGFTMSIFVAELSFPGNAEALHLAKTGIILASVTSGALGYFWLRIVGRIAVDEGRP
jgi:NhaA family Na+:H+ antiporter